MAFREIQQKDLNVNTFNIIGKIKNVGFTPIFIDGVPTFEEASLVFIVEKIYADTIKPEKFIDKDIDARIYSEKDYHTMYISKIKKVLVKE